MGGSGSLRILITGGTGFIGRRLTAAALARAHSVGAAHVISSCSVVPLISECSMLFWSTRSVALKPWRSVTTPTEVAQLKSVTAISPE